jgi:hypothetical protein
MKFDEKYFSIYEELISEKIYTDLDEDVDMLYEMFFKDLIDAIFRSLKNEEMDPYIEDFHKEVVDKTNDDEERIGTVYRDIFDKNFGSTTSAILKSNTAKEAHKKNPINLYFSVKPNTGQFGGLYRSHNYYVHPTKDKQGYISFCLYSELLEDLLESGWSTEYMENDNSTLKKISPYAIKSIIMHELSHWVRFTKNEGFDVDKKRQKREELLKRKNISYKDIEKFDNEGRIHSTAMDSEIDAVIHEIYRLRKEIVTSNGEDVWNNASLEDLYKVIDIMNTTRVKILNTYNPDRLYGMLSHNDMKKYNKARFDNDIESMNKILKKYRDYVIREFRRFENSLVKRMSRENLLGKNMKTFTKIKDTPLTDKIKVQ